MIALSQVQFDTIYARLGVKFDHTLGESFYNPRLDGSRRRICATRASPAKAKARSAFSATARCRRRKIRFSSKDGEWVPDPRSIQKSDGGFNYTTTDLATLDYRLEDLAPDEIIYVTDGRQQLHFRQLFAVFRRWHPDART